MRKPYKTDLADARWKIVKRLIPPAKPGGRSRTIDMREVLNTLLYQARTGCQWELPPRDLLPKSTVRDYFAQWRDDGTWRRILDAPRPQVCKAKAREPTPRAGYIDRQTVKTTEVGDGSRVRRRQEDQRAEAASPVGLAGLASGDGDRGGLRRRWSDGSGGSGAVGSARAPSPGGDLLWGQQVQTTDSWTTG